MGKQAYNETKIGEIQNYTVDPDALAAIAEARIAYSSGEGYVDVAVDGSVPLAGVTLDAADVEKRVDVQSGGIARVEAGETIAVNDNITAGAGGKAAVASAGDWIIGQAKTAGGNGEFVSVQLELCQLVGLSS